jgi:hypothetical protein
MVASRAVRRSALTLFALLGGCTCPAHPPDLRPLPGSISPGATAPARAHVPAANAITAPWRDDFARSSLGNDWYPTSPVYRLEGGAVRVQKAYNHPLWLTRPLPRDVVVELEATSYSPSGDIKVELFGDGQSYATTRGAYTATGYILVLGGWQNTISAIARIDEHGRDRKERRDFRVEPGRSYAWKIVRKQGKLSWWIDGQLFLEYDDPSPLAGPGHAYFAINNWESDVAIRNLRIAPAP